MKVWPPIPLMSGYGIQPGKAILRTEMESGTARQRRLSNSVPTRVPGRWTLNQAGFKAFEAWFRHTLKDGTAWYSQQLVNGSGSVTVDARFPEPYRAEMVSAGVWQITAELEVRNFPVMSEAELESYLG